MKERPILFSAPMVKAIIDGRKTMTRRVAKDVRHPDFGNVYAPSVLSREPQHVIERACPFGQPGELLWVRETWQYAGFTDDGYPWIRYKSDGAKRLIETGISDEWNNKLNDIWFDLSDDANFDIDGCAADRVWRPCIFMPRWASRLTLEITGVRVERLWDISEDDAWAEGVDQDVVLSIPAADAASAAFSVLWESVNGVNSWDANPWVWVVEFRRLEGKAQAVAA